MDPDAPLVRRSGLGGFQYSDPYSSTAPDALHIIRLGLHLYIINTQQRSILTGRLEEAFPVKQRRGRALTAVNTRLKAKPRFLGSRLPTDALSCTKASGDELDFLIKCLPPALLASPELDEMQAMLAGAMA